MIMMPKTERLSNGTRVVLVPGAATAAATCMVLFEVGSRYEEERINGGSHYIEHMMFKGTDRRPQSIDISRDLDAVGADYNAFTGKDHTEYYIRLEAGHLPLAIDMLEDMAFHSAYRPADLESERKVILEEIRMYEDNPAMFVEELMEAEVYRGHPLGQRISGTVETMNGITREALVAFRDAYYVPSRTVVAVAGKFDRRKTLAMLEAKFGKRKRLRSAPYLPFSAADAKYDKTRVHVRNKDTEQVQLSLGWPAYGLDKDAKLSAMSLLSVILGGTMSSRLFMSVREREGLCYSIRAGANPFQDVGNFTIDSGLAKARIHEAIPLIMSEVRRIRDEDVTDEELSRAKENIKGRTALRLEESAHLAEWYAKQMLLTKKLESPDSKLKKLMRITKSDIRRVAAEVFRPERLSLAVIGPFDDPAAFTAHAALL